MKLFDNFGDRTPMVLRLSNPHFMESLAAGGAKSLDALLIPEVRWLRHEYKQTGNPRLIYLAGSSYTDLLKAFPATRYSFQYALLQSLLGEMLIAQGNNAETLHAAVKHIETALEIMDSVSIMSEETLRAQVSCALLLGVARKALGEFDESLFIMRKLSKVFIDIASATEVDLVPIRRQEIMMHQTMEGHRQLAEEAVRYRTLRPLEYYRSLKRVFEYVMNNDGILEAEQIYPEFRRAFASISHMVGHISHVSFAKNVGQFLMTRGQLQAAAVVLNRSLKESRVLNLHGQVRQLEILVQEAESDASRGKLVTFMVGNYSQ
jgi:hypothetical protein